MNYDVVILHSTPLLLEHMQEKMEERYVFFCFINRCWFCWNCRLPHKSVWCRFVNFYWKNVKKFLNGLPVVVWCIYKCSHIHLHPGNQRCPWNLNIRTKEGWRKERIRTHRRRMEVRWGKDGDQLKEKAGWLPRAWMKKLYCFGTDHLVGASGSSAKQLLAFSCSCLTSQTKWQH